MIVYWFMPHPLPPSFMRGWLSVSEAGGSKNRILPNSPSQKSKIFDSPLLKAGAEGRC